ncbi:uncharacterized protein LOC111406031 isoform X1 [Olea europaea var. sylvestris]|uniref:uncharacterized protein LOC111406031 isoform X1 n=1 Tax=Olea europaea var. sylvestris TaxID=158386 RepID=UPI000C1D5A75|nr:uncharacterized protein LOC111406031 isoform X1 [Olea europaea var. sylvestris]
MNLNPFKRRHQRTSKEIRRLVVADKPRDITRRDRRQCGNFPVSLSMEEEEELEIAAYLSLWLYHFVLPFGDESIRGGTFKASSKMAGGYTYSLVPPILASIYSGLTRTSNYQANLDLGSISHSFPGHFLYTWAVTYFVRDVYAHVDKSYSHHIIQRYAGTLNAFQSWEKNVIDCREFIRGAMNSDNFCWNPLPSSSHPYVRVDDQPRSTDTSEFMMSIRSGFVSYH